MIELGSARKNKINLDDYDYQKDIQNRLFLSNLAPLEVEVLEEIIYSTLKIPLRKLARDLDLSEEEILPILNKLEESGLFRIENDTLIVNKDTRKYYETGITKFDVDFKPDMEYVYNFLKKVPIHVLPVWYSIPRTSNNIFESILEKFLKTPLLYQRYYSELGYQDPIITEIMEDVFNAPDFCVTAEEIRKKYDLSPELFEEYILHLEFNFICALSYQKLDDTWIEVLTPFHEWKEHLLFIRDKSPVSIENTSLIKRKRPSNFAFVEDAAKILLNLSKKPAKLEEKDLFQRIIKTNDNEHYINELLGKMQLIKLIEIKEDHLHAKDTAQEWLEMTTETKALYLYRHSLNCLLTAPPSYTEKQQREAEKSIRSVIDHSWVLFDDFIQGAIAILDDEKKVVLHKKGRNWSYRAPHYSETDIAFIRASLFEGLFQSGMVAVGEIEEKDCFTVTPFGQTFFGS